MRLYIWSKIDLIRPNQILKDDATRLNSFSKFRQKDLAKNKLDLAIRKINHAKNTITRMNSWLLHDYSLAFLQVKGTLIVRAPVQSKKRYSFKIMPSFFSA